MTLNRYQGFRPALRTLLVGVALLATVLVLSWADAALASHGGKRGQMTYRVDGDTIFHKRSAVKPAHARMWQRFVQLIPAERRTMLRKFIVFKGGFSDAYVGQLRRDPYLWEMGVNRALLKDSTLDEVLVHEFGHLLTLGPDQILPYAPNEDHGKCRTYRTQEGCANPGSYPALFIDEFWRPTGALADWRRIDRIQNERRYQRAQRQFWRQHKHEFLSRYAATDPAEDMAESFAHFVLFDTPHKGGIAAKKYHFFERFPELVQLRDTIRANMAA